MNRKPRRKRSDGFTMIELMVVVVIVAVLSAIAIPMYGKYVKNARLSEATARIGEILTSCKAYAQEHVDENNVPQWPAGADGIVDLSDTELFSYAITSGGGSPADATPLTIRATGKEKMTGVTVDVTVNSISSNGGPPIVAGL